MRTLLTMILLTPLYSGPSLAQLASLMEKASQDQIKLLKKIPLVCQPSWKAYSLHYSSQRWLTQKEVDKPLWTHHGVLVIPPNARKDTLYVHISNGDTTETMPRVHPELKKIAQSAQTAVIELRQVPNQPLIFHGDGVQRTEDDILAYAWKRFLDTKDPRWIPRLPMLKAAKVGIDFALAELKPKGVVPKHIVVGGLSKRGWTTWLLPLVDKRVTAIAPMIIDVANFQKSMNYHKKALGTWSPAIHHYVKQGIADRLNTKDFADLMALIDPIKYFSQLTMPKLIINSANDQFFMPNSSLFYVDKLQGPYALRYLPNTGHYQPGWYRLPVPGTSLTPTLIAFIRGVTGLDAPLPKVSWASRKGTRQEFFSSRKPKAARLWVAESPREDFRLMSAKFPKYVSYDLKAKTPGTFSAELPKSGKGYVAYFAEFEYEGAVDYRLSSPVWIIGGVNPG